MVKAGRIVPPPGHGFSGRLGCCAPGQSGVGALPEFRRALPWSLLPPAPAFPLSLFPPLLQSCLNLISHLFFSEMPHPPLLCFQALLKKFPKWCVVSALSQSCNAQLCQEICTQGTTHILRCQPGRRDPAFLGAGFSHTPNGQELVRKSTHFNHLRTRPGDFQG